MLLFVVLFYIYPLKYLTLGVLGGLFQLPNRPSLDDARYVTLIYSGGTILIFGTFLLLYQHAWRQPQWLALAGLLYGLMGPLHAWNGYRNGAAPAALDKQRSAPAE